MIMNWTAVVTCFMRLADKRYLRKVFSASAVNPADALDAVKEELVRKGIPPDLSVKCGELVQLYVFELWAHHPDQREAFQLPHAFTMTENADESWELQGYEIPIVTRCRNFETPFEDRPIVEDNR